MARQLRCPNCGGEHTLVNPGITMLVCDFCKTVVYWGEDTVLQMGEQSILPEADTRLFMHATGDIRGRVFEVVGHLRYDHGRGNWDEWYLQLDDDSVAWISEDERELSLERAIQADQPVPPPEALQTGAPLSLDGAQYTVRELGTATCIGGEGQLPFTILPGEQYPYADLATVDGTRFATLEYDEDTGPTCFSGDVLEHGDLTVDDDRPPSTAGSHEGRDIHCPNCDAPMEVDAGREVETQVCEYCGAQNDLTGAEARVMGVNPEDYDPGFYFEIGRQGTFLSKPYEVCGRLQDEDDEGYSGHEYLLFNPDDGYLWLAEESNHFLLNRPTQQAPLTSPFNMAPQTPVKVGPTTFRFFESGASRLVYVDGSLPWLARTGDVTRYADLVAPPHAFSVESTGTSEVEYFRGQYMTPEEVWTAFSAEGPAPRAMGVHPAQPFSRGPVAKALIVLGGVFGLVNLLMLLWSLSSGGKQLLHHTFVATDYLKETISQPFTVGKDKVMAMQVQSNLRNSWISLQAALVNAQDQVVAEMEGDISYYSGVEGGESWSEGNRKTTTYYKSPPAGTYRLLLKAAAGSGRTGPPRGEGLTITLSQGMVLSRYFLALMIISFLFPIFEITRRHLFEKRRWAPVMEDDDDDDEFWE